jgi:hypothetical protein
VTLSRAGFEARQATWLALSRGNYHLFWHPQMTDFALNRVPAAKSIEHIVRSTKFLRACQEFAARKDSGLSGIPITASLLLDRSSSGASQLGECFLRAQVRRVMQRLRMTRCHSSEEDVYSTIRHQFFAQANDYRVGIEVDGGNFKTFGFTAFHQQFIRRAWTGITAGFCCRVSLDQRSSEDDEKAERDWLENQIIGHGETERHLELLDFRQMLVASLRAALSEPKTWEVFHRMIYQADRLSEIALEFGTSVGHISDTVTNCILAQLRSDFSDLYIVRSAPRIRITDIRDSLTDCLPEADFLRYVPCPMSLPLPLARQTLRRGRTH